MKKLVLCTLILQSIMQISSAQTTRYVIKFRDKGSNPYTLATPSAFLSQRAINRRTQYSLPLDSTDLPVTPRYIDSIRAAGAVTVLNISKWLNSVSIQTSDAAALAKINSFPFVQSSAPVAARMASAGEKFDEAVKSGPVAQRESGAAVDFFSYGSSRDQVHLHNGEFLHNIGLRGQGMIIGMLDGGFQNYLTVRAFDSVRANGQILGTWDFVAREASVNEDHPHGMECFSTIAANIPGQFVGTAPGAGFYLFRSEDVSSEYLIEEHNWVCAAERVDSAGGDLISSSVGYNIFDNPAFNHTYAELNGNTTMIATGADLAARKGILVVNSAGNEGDKSWGKIITPADGDSVMAVGAVTAAGVPANFTSRGPSSDGQVKPDVASMGVATVVQLPTNITGTAKGTSFAAPNLAGLTACLWQGFREFNNMKIIEALRRSGSRATNPNDTIGYGIPDVKKATLFLLDAFATASVTLTNCTAALSWSSKDITGMKYEIERKVAGQTIFTKTGEVNARGNSFSSQTYTFQDDLKDVPQGALSYRIRQVIDTAREGFSAGYIDTVQASLATSCLSGITEISLLPNPSPGKLTVKIVTVSAVPHLTIRLFNALGQVIEEWKGAKAEGITFIEVPVFHLPKALYYVAVYDDRKRLQTKKLIRL